ncbi:MAG TPA: alpha-L-fucosidase, partial [Sedimentisphaerales bacterium]|nr:alpha-L-fucosidase [Sedimentisphaerales bacterium]
MRRAKSILSVILVVAFGLILVSSACTKENASGMNGPRTETRQQRDDRMQWWRESRFGMFVHWGLYSGLAGTWKGKP